MPESTITKFRQELVILKTPTDLHDYNLSLDQISFLKK